MISEFAPAKINLTLRVGPIRNDGYHPVDSVVVFADWGDRLSVSSSQGFNLSINGEGADTLGDEPDNLVLKAARLLHKTAELPVSTGASIHLDKAIPLGSGLGGGSADAAAAFRALNRLWALNWPLDKLADLGAKIGSDIPACIWSKPLCMTGRGELIDLINPWPELHGVLCLPGISVSTARVFAAFDQAAPNPLGQTSMAVIDNHADALPFLTRNHNDLQPAAIHEAPVISTCMTAMRETEKPMLVRMSCSGSTVFAIYENRAASEDAADLLEKKNPTWKFVPVRFGGH